MKEIRRISSAVERWTLDVGRWTLAAFLAACLLSSCATKPKIYHAPDAAKVEAASKRHSAAVDKAVATAGRAQMKVNDAQKSADQLAGVSADVIRQVRELAALVPPELRGKMSALESTVEKQQVHEAQLIDHLDGAQREQAMLGGELAEAVATKLDLFSKQTQYQAEARDLAHQATNERNYRIAAEKQLSREKWFRILWRIGGGFLVLGIIALFILWLLGKWSIKGARAYFRI